MTTQTPLSQAGADFVRSASEIRQKIHTLETKSADTLYPKTHDSCHESHYELTGRLDGLYFVLGEDRPLYTPIYLFNHLRKKHQSQKAVAQISEFIKSDTKAMEHQTIGQYRSTLLKMLKKPSKEQKHENHRTA